MKITSLSQGHLGVWETCRRKFKYLFLDELSLPSPERQSHTEKGKLFHLLVQQERMGLDIHHLTELDSTIQEWLHKYRQFPPPTIKGKEYLEHRRVMTFGKYMLTVVYDLLILGDNQGQIVDWKTHQKPIPLADLQTNWQTRLYLYLLQQTTTYACDQLSMVYWFANGLPPHHTVTIRYSQKWHAQIQQELAEIITAIDQEEQFSKLLPDSKLCQTCEFNYRCHSGRDQSSGDDLDYLDIDKIPEVPIS